MGRTIHYSLFGDEGIKPIPWNVRREVDLAQQMMNQRFSWSCEQLSLDLFEFPEITYSDSTTKDRHAWKPRLGTGFTKVGGDEWNSELVVTFVRWVSNRLPTVTVRLYDEGDYVLAGHLVVQGGSPALDPVAVGKQREFLVSNEFTDAVRALDDAVEKSSQGIFFADVRAKEYIDRPEVRALGLTDAELETMTLHDVSLALQMPWQTEWLKAGA